MIARFTGLHAVAVVLGVGLAAAAAQPAGDGPRIAVEDAWVRPLPRVVPSAEIYFVIRNTGRKPDRLLGGRSPACGRIELYESYHTREGAMGMRQVQGGAIDVPPGQAVRLQAGGLHLMCMAKKQELASGSRVPLTLRFQTAGDVPISVAVRER